MGLLSSRFYLLLRLVYRQVNKAQIVSVKFCFILFFVAFFGHAKSSGLTMVYDLDLPALPLSVSLNRLSDISKTSGGWPSSALTIESFLSST